MKIIFFGTGSFGLPTLKKLLASKHDVVAIVTQPDSRKGRNMNIMPSPVRALSEKAAPGIEVLQPSNMREAAFTEHLKGKGADVFVVVDYGRLLVKELLDIPAELPINLHPSLLPAYRGAAPVNWAIMNGEEETGNTVIKMSERMDAGEIIIQENIHIMEGENAPQLSERLAKSGAELIMKALDLIASGDAELREQDEKRASTAPKLVKQDGVIDWGEPAARITRKIRAMQPWPGAFTTIGGKTLKIFKASVVPPASDNIPPGAVLDPAKFIVRTGDGALEIGMAQMEGKKIMSTREFLRGCRLDEGYMLGK